MRPSTTAALVLAAWAGAAMAQDAADAIADASDDTAATADPLAGMRVEACSFGVELVTEAEPLFSQSDTDSLQSSNFLLDVTHLDV